MTTPTRREFQEFQLQCLEHYDWLVSMANRMTMRRDGALDLVQDTMVRAMRSWRQYQPSLSRGGIRSWLLRIMRNLSITRHRQGTRDAEVIAEYAAESRATTSTADALGSRARYEIRTEVMAAVGKLPPVYRVVVRAELAGKKYQEIASLLGIPTGTVMSRLFRARLILERELGHVVDRTPARPPRTERRASRARRVDSNSEPDWRESEIAR